MSSKLGFIKNSSHRFDFREKIVRSLPWLIFLFILPACGTTPPAPSEKQLAGIALNNRAERAFKEGRLKKALSLYNEALSAGRSIEDNYGIAANLISLAAVHKRLGDHESAHRYLDEALDTTLIDFPPEKRAEAAFIKGILYLEAGQVADALKMADLALTPCSPSACKATGQAYNLKARLSLMDGDGARAEALARKALDVNKKFKNMEEAANSLRLIGDGALSSRQFTKAAESYSEALIIDKRLGISTKIASDLRGLGAVEFERGAYKDALAYFLRAHSVSLNGKDAEGRQKAGKMIRACEEKLE